MSTPCNECPFRRKSVSGYIGGHEDVGEIIDIIEDGGKFPCHMHVNQMMDIQEKLGNKRDFELACQSAVGCRGSLAFVANSGVKVHPVVKMQAEIVGPREDVFSSRDEMEEHHRKGFKSR